MIKIKKVEKLLKKNKKKKELRKVEKISQKKKVSLLLNNYNLKKPLILKKLSLDIE